MAATPLIELSHVSKGFAGRPVLTDLSFHVGRGEIVGFIGPNGSGKTTTVRLLNGVIDPDGGRIRVGGYEPRHDGEAVRTLSGILTESAGLYPNLTGRANLRFFADLYGVPEAGRPDALLEEFGLADAADRKVGAYSTGMKKRLGMAKALLHRPAVRSRRRGVNPWLWGLVGLIQFPMPTLIYWLVHIKRRRR